MREPSDRCYAALTPSSKTYLESFPSQSRFHVLSGGWFFGLPTLTLCLSTSQSRRKAEKERGNRTCRSCCEARTHEDGRGQPYSRPQSHTHVTLFICSFFLNSKPVFLPSRQHRERSEHQEEAVSNRTRPKLHLRNGSSAISVARSPVPWRLQTAIRTVCSQKSSLGVF